jgi:hypothetical protein
MGPSHSGHSYESTRGRAPGSSFSAAREQRDRLRLSFGLGFGTLEDGLHRLAEAWREYAGLPENHPIGPEVDMELRP